MKKAPSSKHQYPGNIKIQNPKKNQFSPKEVGKSTRELITRVGVWDLEFLWSLDLGVWSFPGAWILVLGVSSDAFQNRHRRRMFLRVT